MRALITWLAACLAAAALGAGGAGLAELPSARLGILLAGALVCGVAFVLWPWSVLPAGVIGGVGATTLLSDGHVTFVVEVHAGVLAVGCLALLARKVVSPGCDKPIRTVADGPMLGFAAFILLAAGYGLACGNTPHQVLIAGYEFAVVPAYFFLATHTLTSPQRLKAAGILYVVGAAVLAASDLTTPGRHGGLLSVLAIPPLLVAVGRLRGWRQVGLLLLIAGFTVDATLASYRAMWLVTGVALLILLIRGTASVRRGVAAAVITGALLTVSVATFSTGAQARSALVGQELHESAGYRAQEASIGLNAFTTRPLIGHGLGQSVPHVYLPDFAVTDIGPTYHVFYVMILANLGLVGLALMGWPLAQALRGALASRDGQALAFASLTCGFLAAAAFAGPTDGHWELGLLAALTLMSSRAGTGLAGSCSLGGTQ
ncbi:O-antigen ligase family protein [Streptomyces sp. H10-C2]|uniref:O-antigen ligase family protein n=1 Tax=unclassified Streptomyces TaxID=2593676 RepID=UPI0024BB7580|nr:MULTISPECIES: O-antigen ligase family protein [unclassified Streptomyces]MDJ0341177.1 O-antigen ligase family protein [Streptomyces sp. PH10-H1]MDJ0369470.1 O-antigen ligase family protein [Streptomyces sp. H10-C2]